MTYFNVKDIVAIAMAGAVWSVVNNTILPIFFTITSGLPILCEMMAFASLILVLWWTRKFGAVTATGLIVTLITLSLRPDATHVLGFTAASIIFDVTTRLVGYNHILGNSKIGAAGLIGLSFLSSTVAGIVISSFFMPLVLLNIIGGAIVFTGLHASGGLIGAILGIGLVKTLEVRKVVPMIQRNLS